MLIKKQLLFYFLLLSSVSGFSQIIFEKGYFITDSNENIECLIKNIDWVNNPTEFDYKLTEDSEQKKGSIDNIKEFGIYNSSKYQKQTVNIDKSSNKINELSNVKDPIFHEEQLFLKVLIEGKASLFSYEEKKILRYFYSLETSKIEQLIYKEYLNSVSKIAQNNTYRQQLWNKLPCPSTKMKQLEALEYRKNDLAKFFISYNQCKNHEFKNFINLQKKDLFNLNLRLGINNSDLSLKNSSFGSRNNDFNNELGLRFGVEAEFIMPFNKNKWSIIIEPMYQSYKSKKTTNGATTTATYNSLELPIGLRHYFFINDNSKLFINASFILNKTSDSSLIDFETRGDLEVRSANNAAFGIGYKHNNKYSLELRYHTPKNILTKYLLWTSDFNTLSLIFGYSLF